MSQYMQQLCEALIRVFDRCTQLDRRRLAGYVQDIDFWIAQVQHRLSIIDGYVERRRRMIDGTKAVYTDDIQGSPSRDVDLVSPNVIDTSANWDELQAEAIALRKAVLESTKRFVMHCLDEKLIDTDKLFEIEDVLQANLRSKAR